MQNFTSPSTLGLARRQRSAGASTLRTCLVLALCFIAAVGFIGVSVSSTCACGSPPTPTIVTSKDTNLPNRFGSLWEFKGIPDMGTMDWWLTPERRAAELTFTECAGFEAQKRWRDSWSRTEVFERLEVITFIDCELNEAFLKHFLQERHFAIALSRSSAWDDHELEFTVRVRAANTQLLGATRKLLSNMSVEKDAPDAVEVRLDSEHFQRSDVFYISHR